MIENGWRTCGDPYLKESHQVLLNCGILIQRTQNAPPGDTTDLLIIHNLELPLTAEIPEDLPVLLKAGAIISVI